MGIRKRKKGNKYSGYQLGNIPLITVHLEPLERCGEAGDSLQEALHGILADLYEERDPCELS